MNLRLPLRLSLAIGLIGLCSVVQGQGLLLDIQPLGNTTATGYQELGSTNQAAPPAAANYTAASTGFGSDVSVLFGVANLPDGNLDFRAVTRAGSAAEDILTDWVGVDTRDSGVDVTMTLTFAGLAAGDYNWTSYHSDGGDGVTNGNLNGSFDYSLGNAGAAVIPDGVTIYEGDLGFPNNTGTGLLNTSFTSDGTDVIFTMIMDNGQGEGDNNLFAFANGIEITTSPIPEPTSCAFLGMGALGLVLRRRRNS